MEPIYIYIYNDISIFLYQCIDFVLDNNVFWVLKRFAKDFGQNSVFQNIKIEISVFFF